MSPIVFYHRDNYNWMSPSIFISMHVAKQLHFLQIIFYMIYAQPSLPNEFIHTFAVLLMFLTHNSHNKLIKFNSDLCRNQKYIPSCLCPFRIFRFLFLGQWMEHRDIFWLNHLFIFLLGSWCIYVPARQKLIFFLRVVII